MATRAIPVSSLARTPRALLPPHAARGRRGPHARRPASPPIRLVREIQCGRTRRDAAQRGAEGARASFRNSRRRRRRRPPEVAGMPRRLGWRVLWGHGQGERVTDRRLPLRTKRVMSWCPTLGVEEAELRYAGNRLQARRRVELAVTQYLEEADGAVRPAGDRRCRTDRPRGDADKLRAELSGAKASREPTLDECSSTPPAAPRARRRRGPGGRMNQAWILGERALRETLRTPDSLIPTLFIPLFFLVVNTGQAARIFPSDDDAVPPGSELRRLPAPGVDAAGGVVRQRRAVPGRGDRGRLLRQAAGDADLAYRRSCSAVCTPSS